MEQELFKNSSTSSVGSDNDASFIFNHQEDNILPKRTSNRNSPKRAMMNQPQGGGGGKLFNPSPKVFWFALATFIILTLAIVVIVIIVCQTNKHLRNCRTELQQQKRETLHYQELLEKRMNQMMDGSSENDDLMPEIMDEQDLNLAAQEQQNNRGSLAGSQQHQTSTDPNGSRIRREETRVGDLMMDREMRTKSIRMQSGSATFPKK